MTNPSADIIQYAIDLRHLAGVVKELDLKVSGDALLSMTLAVRETEARMRSMDRQGGALVSLIRSQERD